MLFIKIGKKLIGQDEFGNKYYVSKKKNRDGNYRRFVEYKGSPEPTKVPPAWHAWLHSVDRSNITGEDIPTNTQNYEWQIDHQPNLTLTIHAYKQPFLQTGQCEKTSGDYERWTPQLNNK